MCLGASSSSLVALAFTFAKGIYCVIINKSLTLLIVCPRRIMNKKGRDKSSLDDGHDKVPLFEAVDRSFTGFSQPKQFLYFMGEEYCRFDISFILNPILHHVNPANMDK